ncbi:hypothetical protein [Flexithrix dorotheae]|uniref:hypothetical protein n=1 Tax=Flexithrix dorotheae TaxID=70993 RepID=UPI0003802BA3|nr:hypothetical protein [Flexithrix dorotheae]
MRFKTFFHYLSYLQYPLLLIGLYFVLRPYFSGFEYLRENPKLLFQSLNSVLIFMGLAISFSSLQDTTKTQNKFSRKIWEDPVKGKVALILMCFLILFTLLFGLTGYYITPEGIIKELSIGTIVFSLGMFGLLKAALEMFENHRKDKNPEAFSKADFPLEKK